MHGYNIEEGKKIDFDYNYAWNFGVLTKSRHFWFDHPERERVSFPDVLENFGYFEMSASYETLAVDLLQVIANLKKSNKPSY